VQLFFFHVLAIIVDCAIFFLVLSIISDCAIAFFLHVFTISDCAIVFFFMLCQQFQTAIVFSCLNTKFRSHICCYFQVVSTGSCHTCASTSQARGKEASKAWIANRATEVLKTTPNLGAKKLQVELERQFPIKMSYNKVWEGRQLALKGLHGTWDESFRMLWS
jgi:hypothetical protein